MDFKIVLLCLLLGVVTGLRTMTGLAVIGFTAYFGWINLKESPLAFLSSPLAVILLLLGALGEFIADKLPRTGKRIAPAPLLARMTAGGFCGAAICFASGQLWPFGVVSGTLGALVGSFAGYYARTALVKKMRTPDILVAIPEDLLAISLAVAALLAL